ncbi:protein of unknown function [Georgfuchsia toluolica]|uniref:Uncharacterized protein n=1 Tax=Georgfuchsia toluolica TaxID=424218 RepID=A0A916J5K9_9PROT|nr:protein of unknown function [Georgfuchsia toluolica]
MEKSDRTVPRLNLPVTREQTTLIAIPKGQVKLGGLSNRVFHLNHSLAGIAYIDYRH